MSCGADRTILVPELGNPSDAVLPASARRVPKATYVRQTGKPSQSAVHGALHKYAFAERVGLRHGEVAAVHKAMTHGQHERADEEAMFKALAHFEGNHLQSDSPPRTILAKVSEAELLAFAFDLVAHRRAEVEVAHRALSEHKSSKHDAREADHEHDEHPGGHEHEKHPEKHGQRSGHAQHASGHTKHTDHRHEEHSDPEREYATALHLLHSALVARSSLEANSQGNLVGWLNFEQLEMTPAGIVRGELVGTVPLAPLEQTTVTQTEWSTTRTDFTSMVDQLSQQSTESKSTDSNELASSTEAKSSHSSKTSVSGSVSAGIPGFVSASVSPSFESQDQNSSSATASTKHAQSTTKAAASSAKQEHKVTISTSTASGTSASTARILRNPSPTQPIRVDYYGFMTRWHVALYRYALRMTYDLVVPEPGAALRSTYRELAQLQQQATQQFTPPFTYAQITPERYDDETLLNLAAELGADLTPPPQPVTLQVQPGTSGQAQTHSSDPQFVDSAAIEIDLPTGYEIDAITLELTAGTESLTSGLGTMTIVGYPGPIKLPPLGTGQLFEQRVALDQDPGSPGQQFMHGMSGSPKILCTFQNMNPVFLYFKVCAKPSQQTVDQWRSSTYASLSNAAQTAYYARQQTLASEISMLQAQINGVDDLTLRQEEHEEIMKAALRWLLGPTFDFMPASVGKLLRSPAPPRIEGVVVEDGNSASDWGMTAEEPTAVNQAEWTVVNQYEQWVRFVHEAIDWDNLVYLTYPYFWDIPSAWENIRNIRHGDAQRQAFLRAGSARVVLTVMPGWETSWVQAVEGGDIGTSHVPADHPYMTIAQEIQDYDETNYPGIPPANPGGTAPPRQRLLCRNRLCGEACTVHGARDAAGGLKHWFHPRLRSDHRPLGHKLVQAVDVRRHELSQPHPGLALAAGPGAANGHRGARRHSHRRRCTRPPARRNDSQLPRDSGRRQRTADRRMVRVHAVVGNRHRGHTRYHPRERQSHRLAIGICTPDSEPIDADSTCTGCCRPVSRTGTAAGMPSRSSWC